jgi:Xaa-Pro aminopeptidase
MAGTVTSDGGTFSFPPTCSVRGEILHNRCYTNTLSKGDLLLVDAGATSPGHYAGDITRVTPVGGPFTDRQRAVYEAVLSAQTAALDALAPEVPFIEVHEHAAQVLTEHLITMGLMQGDAEAAVAAGAHALFFPHGLGHLMGLDVHDMENLGEDRVGYAADQTRSDQFGLHALRLARPLEPGFVVTVEPGCYFIPPLVRQWREEKRHDRFINYDRVEDFLGLGGVRIEDDVLITADGSRVLGPDIPKAPAEVEARAGTAGAP